LFAFCFIKSEKLNWCIHYAPSHFILTLIHHSILSVFIHWKINKKTCIVCWLFPFIFIAILLNLFFLLHYLTIGVEFFLPCYFAKGIQCSKLSDVILSIEFEKHGLIDVIVNGCNNTSLTTIIIIVLLLCTLKCYLFCESIGYEIYYCFLFVWSLLVSQSVLQCTLYIINM